MVGDLRAGLDSAHRAGGDQGRLPGRNATRPQRGSAASAAGQADGRSAAAGPADRRTLCSFVRSAQARRHSRPRQRPLDRRAGAGARLSADHTRPALRENSPTPTPRRGLKPGFSLPIQAQLGRPSSDWYNGILRGSVSLRMYFRLFAHTQLMPILENGEETTLVGGQAVMEGVMMRAPHSYCVAVRKADGEIVTEQMPLPRMADKYKIFKYPIFRGVGTLAQAMSLGMKALKFSADVSLEEIQKEEKKNNKEAKEVPGWVLAAN